MKNATVTKQEFEDGYIKRSKISKEFYDKHFVTMSCNCIEECCQGWAAIHKGNEDDHKKFYQ